MNVRRATACAILLGAAAALWGCGAFRETLPARSATEQLLISTAADRAIARLPQSPFAGKRVYVVATNLDCLDEPYVTQRIRQAVLESDASLAAGREEADLALEVASGGLSIDRRDYLLGLPELTIPIPFADGNVVLPELPLFKILSYKGRAKLIFSPVDTQTRRLVEPVATCSGASGKGSCTVLFFISFSWTDIPEEKG